VTQATPTSSVVPSPSPTSGDSGALTVEEYPIVAKEVDSPGHIGYMQRIDTVTVLEERLAWRRPSPEGRVANTNQVLGKFGYRLVPREKPGCPTCVLYDLYHGDKLVQSMLNVVWPITVNDKGDDFALLVEDDRGRDFLIRRDAVEPWDPSRHAFKPPVYAGDSLVTIEVDYEGGQMAVRRGNEIVYTTPLPPPSPEDPVKGLWSWRGRWVLELKGQVVVDGKSLNQELGYDEIFGWRLLKGQPFYFFTRDGRVGVSYAGEVLPYQYDEVVHYKCCEPAAFNVAGNDTMVWFHALRDGMWYYVEMGVYE